MVISMIVSDEEVRQMLYKGFSDMSREELLSYIQEKADKEFADYEDEYALYDKDQQMWFSDEYTAIYFTRLVLKVMAKTDSDNFDIPSLKKIASTPLLLRRAVRYNRRNCIEERSMKKMAAVIKRNICESAGIKASVLGKIQEAAGTPNE